MKKYYFAGATFLLLIFTSSLVFSQSYIPEWKDAKIKVKPVGQLKAYAFDLSSVKLLPSPFTIAMDADVKYLLEIEPDRLLSGFRSHSGLVPNGKEYGGWESSGLAGHTLGHYLSALSMHYASSGDKEFLSRVNYIVDQLDECQKARKTGYVGAIPNEDSMWAEVVKGNIHSRGFDLNGAWSPWYTVHKIMAGLVDAYLYCNNSKALKVDEGIADWAMNTIKNLNDSLMQKMLITEYGGMNDVLVNIYALTGNKKYLDLSYRFYDRRIMDSLAMQKDILPGKHSNTQIPKIIGSARRYQLTGDKKDSVIANFFWQTVTKHHSYATGGNGNYEYFTEPDKFNDKLSDNNTETCPTYNMLKLTGELFATNPSAELMDYYEKALYNHILATQDHETGMTTYFIPLRMGGKKSYSDKFNTFTCCVGSSMENHVKYNENIYFRGKDGSLYINLFIPSILNWKEKGLSIKQETGLPSTDKSTFTISTPKPASFAISIRKPYWTNNVEVRINGVLKNISIDKEGYLVLNRKWVNNDKIELITPLHFYAQAMPDNPNRRAIFYGPVLLAGVLGDKEPAPSDIPVFVTNDKDVNEWISPAAPESLIFHTTSAVTKNKVELIPFNQTENEHYTVYWDVFTPGEWAVQQKIYEAEKAKQKELELHTVDILRIGEMQPERDHDLTAEKSFAGDSHNSKWRVAREDGFISFKMKLDSSAQNTLVCTYWGMDNRGRVFDIYVNDTKIATENLNKFKASKFYEVPYVIPQELTKNKLSAVIKFVPKVNNSAGPIYGVRMVRGEVSGLLSVD